MEVRAPRGFRDYLPGEASRREKLAYRMGQCFDKAGYGLIETPVLEGLDVVKAVSHASANETFRFCDIDGRLVALRNDVTVPVARIVATRFTQMEPPYRLRYCADIFTEQEQLRGQSRQQMQLGIELIGESGPEADAEVLALAAKALHAIELTGFQIHVNDEPSRLKATLAALAERDDTAQQVIVADDTISRTPAYYTGMVFDVYVPGVGAALGGGGRYDCVLAGFGRDMPAAGFALELGRIIEALDVTSDATDPATDVRAPRKLRVAVPKGALFADSVRVLAEAGLDTTPLIDAGRQLYFETDDTIYVIAKPTDVAIYVATGAVDCGIGGHDVLVEADFPLLKLVDLAFGACQFVVASPAADTRSLDERALAQGVVRVATKYPRITQRFFDERGIQIELVKLNGNIEIAPLIDIADVIVDLTATGTTLRENNMVVLDEVMPTTAWFVANPASARIDERIFALADTLRTNVDGSIS
ncbi:MAG: ATP phosphoribosyltransferase [Coriobacteriia bacterium]|nr:ATP phosphoribosyltransferase [Coriobacteriia bacterium]